MSLLCGGGDWSHAYPVWNGTHYVCDSCGGHACRTVSPHTVMPIDGSRCVQDEPETR